MIQYRDLIRIIRALDMPQDRPVLAHPSPAIEDKIQGGEKTLLGALQDIFSILLMPAFTYQTMVYPKKGPRLNGVEYNNPPLNNQNAVFFEENLPVSPRLGSVSEAFRSLPGTKRSTHPILSFSGLQANPALQAQSLSTPYAPLAYVDQQDGWVLLMNVDHTQNFSIHYALNKSGRKLFTRWALTSAGIKRCPHFPGCANGFSALAPRIEGQIRATEKEGLSLRAVPLRVIMHEVQNMLDKNPLALLCEQDHCLRCASIRSRIQETG